MGKLTIISSNDDGSYTATVEYDTIIITEKIYLLTLRIADLTTAIEEAELRSDNIDSQIITVENQIITATTLVGLCQAEYDLAIAEGRPAAFIASKLLSLNSAKAALKDREAALVDAKKELLGLPQTIASLKAKKLSAEKMKAFYEDTSKVPANYNTTVWCADYTTDLSGSVGSIEIGTEIANGINIQPGYESNAVYSASRDGQLTPSMALSGASFFYNMCMFPGTQKWCPGHRYGVITDIDYDTDTCDVTLDALTSSHQGIDINQTISLEDVEIDYMDCNAAAFEINDEIIVEFTPVDPFPTQTPKVIGFKSDPVPCDCFWTESWIGPLVTTKWPWTEDSGVSAYYYQPLGSGTDSFDYDLPVGAVTITLTECADDPPLTQDCSHINIAGSSFTLDRETGYDGSWNTSSSAYYNYLYHTNWINEDPKSFIVNCALNTASMPATFAIEFTGYLDSEWYVFDVLLKNAPSGGYMSGAVGDYSEPFRWYGGTNFYSTQHAYQKTGPGTAEFELVEVDGWIQPYGYTRTYMTTVAPENVGRITLPEGLEGIVIYEAKIIIQYTSTTLTLPAWDVTINHLGVC